MKTIKIENVKEKIGEKLMDEVYRLKMLIDKAERSLTDIFGDDECIELRLDEKDYFKRNIQNEDLTIVGCTRFTIMFEDGSQIDWGDMTYWEAFSVLDGFSFIFEKDKYKDSPFFQGGK